jgi:hypothetical protein
MLVAPVPSLYELAGHYTPSHRENTSHVGVASSVVYYEETKRGLKRILSYECRCNERLKAKAGGSTRLTYTGLLISCGKFFWFFSFQHQKHLSIIVSVFVITDKAKTSRGGGKRCRCYERRRTNV